MHFYQMAFCFRKILSDEFKTIDSQMWDEQFSVVNTVANFYSISLRQYGWVRLEPWKTLYKVANEII